MHTMDMLWEKFHWILPLCMKPINFQSKASVVCSVTAALFIDFCLKKLNVFSQHIGTKTNEYLDSTEKNYKELKHLSIYCANYFLRYYLMMQNQPIVKRVNGAHEWAHRPYQVLSAVQEITKSSSTFSATNISSNIVWFLQLHDTIQMKSNYT